MALAIDNSVYKDGIAQEDNDFILTPDQELAVKLIYNWYTGRGRSPIWKQYYVLSGAAGVGKSSIIQYILRKIGLSDWEVLCCAFTGKAALNLQRKGNRSNTLHSAIYDCVMGINKQPEFYLKDKIDYKFIVVDEASMISEELFDDILSFGIPTLFIGDHCQLPPVNDDFNIMKKPDFTLTTILRQAAKSPIIRASQLAIKGEKIPYCSFKNFRKIKKEELTEKDLLWADQIIVGTNSTRKAINDLVREIKGYRTYSPQEDERMIVLKNNSRMRICNGQIVYLKSNPIYSDRDQCYFVDWLDELEVSDPFLASASNGYHSFKFKLKDPMKEPQNVDTREFAYLDFGYAISCHKSQGSGWDKVLVFDEGFGFDADTKRRWLYTAITRAKKEILIVK